MARNKRPSKSSKASPQEQQAAVPEGRRPGRRRRPSQRAVARAESLVRRWLDNPGAGRLRRLGHPPDLKLPNGVIDRLSGTV